MKLLVGLLAVAVVLFMYTQLGESDSENETGPKVCPSCGVQSLYPSYMGHGKPVRWSCARCGHVKT